MDLDEAVVGLLLEAELVHVADDVFEFVGDDLEAELI